MQDPNCVFCKIVAGNIPAQVITHNENAMALLDAFPLAVGHTLVISRSHQSKIQELTPAETRDVFSLVQQAVSAVEDATDTHAATIAIHNGREAGQEVPHVHVHIIPRTKGDGAGPVHSMFRNRPTLGSQEMNSLRKRISDSIEVN